MGDFESPWHIHAIASQRLARRRLKVPFQLVKQIELRCPDLSPRHTPCRGRARIAVQPCRPLGSELGDRSPFLRGFHQGRQQLRHSYAARLNAAARPSVTSCPWRLSSTNPVRAPGVGTGEVLAEMREADPPVYYLVYAKGPTDAFGEVI